MSYGRWLFAALWAASFLIVFAMSLCSPAIPYLVRGFMAGEAAVAAVIGYLSSAYSLARTVGSFVGGPLTDRVGAIKVILASLLPLPLSYAFYYFAKDWRHLLLGELTAGLCTGLSSPSFSAVVANVVPKGARGTAFGVFNLSWILSQIPAPAIGGYLSKFMGLRSSFAVAALISAATPLMLVGALRSLKRREGGLPGFKGSGALPFTRALACFCAISFLYGLGNGIAIPLLFTFIMYGLKASVAEMGTAISVGWGVATALSQLLGGRLTDKIGSRNLIVLSTIGAIPTYLLIPYSPTLYHFTLLMAVTCLVGNMSPPALSAWIADKIGKAGLGRGFGYASAFSNLGSIIGPIFGGLSWPLFYVSPLLPFLLAGSPLLLTLPLLFLIERR